MEDLDRQLDYWNRIGPGKPFSHPINFERLSQWLAPDSRIIDVGCGYGRALGLLFERGYKNLIGFDLASAMIALARERFPEITFAELTSPPNLPLPDLSVDAALLFAVLTCVPTNQGQRAIIEEVGRVLRPGGLCYISDLWLQTDERNRERYVRDQPKYGTFGVFDLPEGVTLRHHDPAWIETLTRDFETVALDHISIETMNGNTAKGFQWFGLKRGEAEGAAERRMKQSVALNPKIEAGISATVGEGSLTVPPEPSLTVGLVPRVSRPHSRNKIQSTTSKDHNRSPDCCRGGKQRMFTQLLKAT